MISLLWNRLMLHRVFSNSRRFVILPLHSQLSAREQHRVFEPVSIEQRKIILSTNISETSVTIDDVVYVIDSCRYHLNFNDFPFNLKNFLEFVKKCILQEIIWFILLMFG
jgi:HrpA-like RNA helicase